jgi:hypothetical protein
MGLKFGIEIETIFTAETNPNNSDTDALWKEATQPVSERFHAKDITNKVIVSTIFDGVGKDGHNTWILTQDPTIKNDYYKGQC